MIPINPCACKGSCEFVHLNCLKLWMNAKIKKHMSGCATYFKTKYLECEVF
jgi:E3 ubiquitin-protein ligase DOA10